MGDFPFPQGPPDIFDVIAAALAALLHEIVEVLKAIIEWVWENLLVLLKLLVFVFRTLGGALWATVQFVWGGIQKIVNFFKSLWNGFIKNIFAKVFTLTRKVQLWLEEKLAPLIKFLKTARKYWDMIFRRYIKRFLDMMQHIRQVLGVLRQLGFKWAGALDKRIAYIEGQITQLFSQVRGILNGMLDLLNQISDPLRLLRRPMLVLSFRRTFNSLVRLMTGLPPGYFFPSPRSGIAVGLGKLQQSFNKADPGQNPPASAYLKGNDGLGGFSGYVAGQEPDDGDVDEADMLDFFNDDLWPDPEFDNPIDAANAVVQVIDSGSLILRSA